MYILNAHVLNCACGREYISTRWYRAPECLLETYYIYAHKMIYIYIYIYIIVYTYIVCVAGSTFRRGGTVRPSASSQTATTTTRWTSGAWAASSSR